MTFIEQIEKYKIGVLAIPETKLSDNEALSVHKNTNASSKKV